MLMKKLLNKFKQSAKKPNVQLSETGSSSRITNETIAEHRERILAGGRKFKYPHQYPKHRIVITTISIVALSIISFFAFTLWQLYNSQDTGDFIFRVTQILPFPVAKIDDQQVLYSDYLTELRSALHYLVNKEAVNFSSEDGKQQLEYHKRLALDKAEEGAYVVKLASKLSISVSDKEVDDFVNNQIASNHLGVSVSVYRQIIRDYYGWSFDDYKLSVKKQLLRRKLIAAVEVEGRQKINSISDALNKGGNFTDITKQQSEDPMAKSNGGDIGFVSRSADDPNGLIKAATMLQPNQVSGVIKGVDGFYVVKLVESNDSGVHIAKIFVPYKTFARQLNDVKQKGRIKEYIKVKEIVSAKSQ